MYFEDSDGIISDGLHLRALDGDDEIKNNSEHFCILTK